MSIFRKLHWGSGVSVLILLCILGIGVGSLAEVTISSPDIAKPGERVSVYVGDLKAGDHLKIQIDGQIKTNAGDNFSFRIRDMSVPLDLTNAELITEVRNLVPLSTGFLNVTSDGGTSKIFKKGVNAAGIWNDNQAFTTISADHYYISFNGTADKPQVPVKIVLEGNVLNDVAFPQTCTFDVVGFSNGIFNAYVFVNNDPTPIDKKAFTIQDSLLAYRT